MALVPKNRSARFFERLNVAKLLGERKDDPGAVERIFYHYLPALEETICRKAKEKGLDLSLNEENELFFDLRPELLRIVMGTRAKAPLFAIKNALEYAVGEAVSKFKREREAEERIRAVLKAEMSLSRTPEQFAAVYRKEMRKWIEKALLGLTKIERETIRVRYFKVEEPGFSVGRRKSGNNRGEQGELSYAEAGGLMGRSRQAVHISETSAKRKLRRQTMRKELESFLGD